MDNNDDYKNYNRYINNKCRSNNDNDNMVQMLLTKVMIMRIV